MKEISFLERLAENLLEGGFMRALKPKLQPVQLAKALAKEMNRSRMIGPDAPLVANQYFVYLSATDHSQFAGFQSNLERELASYLRGFASRKGYRPIGTISVEIRESSHLKVGQMSIEGKLVDSSPLESHKGESSGFAPPPRGVFEGTMEMPAVNSEPVRGQEALPAPGRPPAALVSSEGEAIHLAKAETSIGRAIDNDVVLEHKSVSRRHAQITWDSGQYLLEDLGSTNGTFVGGKRVVRHRLTDGEEISFGLVSFLFRESRG